MSEVRIPLHMLAGAAWAAGLALVVLEMFTVLPTMGLGLFVAGVGGVTNVKAMITNMEVRVICKQQNAFELGRDYGQNVPHIH